MKDLRREYTQSILENEHLLADPVEQFQEWFRQCVEGGVQEPNCMVLSTVSPDGKPSSRVVLLKEIKDSGFVFFTNYNSRKSVEMERQPAVSLLFFWESMERQVRIEGKAVKIPESESDEYFYSRPLLSQIGAMVSPQSKVIHDRSELENELQNVLENHVPVKRPAHWGGFIVQPDYFEFWQGRENRLHDRFAYTLSSSNWLVARLAP
ncbi:MAG: pyridoxamine 5'-phosphate oxidase [Saprospiraceae bacterium]|nr:pyridoxamine 5'-phosphate oxidase [Saprospiraceae bacterium]